MEIPDDIEVTVWGVTSTGSVSAAQNATPSRAALTGTACESLRLPRPRSPIRRGPIRASPKRALRYLLH